MLSKEERGGSQYKRGRERSLGLGTPQKGNLHKGKYEFLVVKIHARVAQIGAIRHALCTLHLLPI